MKPNRATITKRPAFAWVAITLLCLTLLCLTFPSRLTAQPSGTSTTGTATAQVVQGGSISLTTAELFSGTSITKGSVVVEDAATHGLAVVQFDDKVEYTPDAGYVGLDHVTIQALNEDGLEVTTRVEFRTLPRSLPIAGRLGDDGLVAFGAYDTLTRSVELCAPWNGIDSAGACPRQTVVGARVGWLPVVGDWWGEGKDHLALFDAATGTLHLLALEAAAQIARANWVIESSVSLPPTRWGWPTAGDWYGEGRSRLAVYERATGAVHIIDLSAPTPTTDTWSRQAEPPTGDTLPWPVPWPQTVFADRDAVGIIDADGSALRWLARSGDQFVDGSAGRVFSPDHLPVAGDWPFDNADDVLLFRTLEEGYQLENWDDVRPSTLPVHFPNDPPDG